MLYTLEINRPALIHTSPAPKNAKQSDPTIMPVAPFTTSRPEPIHSHDIHTNIHIHQFVVSSAKADNL